MSTTLKHAFFFMLAIVFVQSSFAQSGIRKIDKKKDKDIVTQEHRFRIGITPSSLLNIYLGLQMNGAVNISDNFQFNLEAGWILSSSAFESAPLNGYRIRPAVRWYVMKEQEYALHLSLGYNIRNTTAQRLSNFTLSNGTSADLNYDQKRIVRGFVALFGAETWLNDRIILDAGIGFGRGTLFIEDEGIPVNAAKSDFLFSNDTPGTTAFPLMVLNIRFQYVI